MLRIAIIDPIGQKAGLDHYDLSFAKSLNSQSCQAKVYSNFSGAANEPFVTKQFSFTFQKNLLNSSGLLISYLLALRKAKSDNAEIIILHLFHSSWMDLFFIRLARFSGFRICIIVHDVESLVLNKGKSKINNCAQLAHHLIVHNKFSFEELIKKIDPAYINKINIVPHGNYLSLKENTEKDITATYFNLDRNRKYILFFGMIKKSKGLDVIINAMKNIHSDVDLIIAGRTRDVDFKEYSLLIEKLKLNQRIHPIVRYITNSERNMLFNFVDLVVIPYRQIYQSGVILLAMSYGIPVIASDLPANKSFIVDNINGILFKDSNSSDLAEKINLIIGDDEKIKSISKNAKDFVAIYHDWNKIGDEFYKILNK